MKFHSVRNKIFSLFFVLAIIAILFAILIGLTSEIRKSRNIDGFTVFLQGKDICAVAASGDTIWAGGIDGLFRLMPSDEFKDGYSVTRVGDFNQVKAVIADGNGTIWVGHDNGLSMVNVHENSFDIETIDDSDGLPDKRVNALYKDINGMLWVGTWGGAVVMDGIEITEILTSDNGLANDMVNAIYCGSDGYVWLGSYVAPAGGISVIDAREGLGDLNEKIQIFTTQNGLLHANINAIIGINNGYVISGGGLYTKGGASLFRLDGDSWTICGSLTRDDGLAGDKVRSLLSDSRGRLWAGSEYDGLAVFHDFAENIDSGDIFEYSEILTDESGLPNNEVKVIAEGLSGDIWAGTRSGLLRIERGGLEYDR